ncbi:MAG: type II toxin-antitoxin system HicA family toxin [Acidobacteriia bacterium]|nr:type II toxin-antitoxin system HicA family toxin [Terriglobia bacterium]
MPKLKSLSGDELLRIFARFGFTKFSQRGSHIKLRRQIPGGGRQTLTIPLHREVDKGTLHAILRQAQRYLAEEELAPDFFVE